MIYKIADNILSPIGLTTAENYSSVVAGRSALAAHGPEYGLPESCVASCFDRDKMQEIMDVEIPDTAEYTFFERLCILSVKRAAAQCDFSLDSDDVRLVLSTTKGNVECLEQDLEDPRCYIGGSADRIARYFGIPSPAITVSNACISGVCAQIAGVRELLSGRCRKVVIVGCDVLSKFIISGFQSFKALSPELCKPYDAGRKGLNLGEAAACMILETGNEERIGKWHYLSGSIHNDANHISGPSRTGEGSYRVLKDILTDVERDKLAFVNAHGTATAYNDEMESIAVHRAELDDVPLNGLKGYYGHTLGAAGLLETILSMKAVENGVVLPTKGYESQGTTYRLNISPDKRETEKKVFIKLLSGFGGSNAGIAWEEVCDYESYR